jgi:flagellar protein FliO/FliZ
MNCSRSLHGAAAAGVCALLLAPAALASTSTSTTATGENTPLDLERPSPTVEHSSGGGGMVRTIVGLAVVIGVIYGLHWILKQVKSGREQGSSGGGLDPLSTLQLAPGRALHLVRAGSEVVLVGSAEHGVTPIRVYSEEEADALGLLAAIRSHDEGGPDPMDSAPGSPPTLTGLTNALRRWTVRR